MENGLMAAFAQYARLDEGEYSEPFVEMLLKTAMTYLTNAGVAIDLEDNLYRLAVFMLAYHWMENPGITLETAYSTVKSSPKGFDCIVTQLKLRDGMWNS